MFFLMIKWQQTSGVWELWRKNALCIGPGSHTAAATEDENTPTSGGQWPQNHAAVVHRLWAWFHPNAAAAAHEPGLVVHPTPCI